MPANGWAASISARVSAICPPRHRFGKGRLRPSKPTATAIPCRRIGELRRAIAAKLIRDNALDADPEREIVVTPGATGAFAAALTALFDPGDGIVLPEPYYGYHLNTIRLCDLDPHFLTLQGPGFELEEAALRSALRPNTRAILLCTPSNPSGKMLSEEEIRRVERVAADHDLLVITDEIYEYLTYDGRQHRSPPPSAASGSAR